MSSILHADLDMLLHAALPLTGSPADFDALIERAVNRSFVLIGEASHGTHEFYRVRAELTKRLIREHGFSAVAIEGDWPDAYRVNRYVRGDDADADATESLDGFTRFPQWMWRNADMLDFVGWLRAHNEKRAVSTRVGVYGLDLYSLHASIAAVLTYLRGVDPAAAERAARRYACFDRYGEDAQDYGFATAIERQPSCETAVVQQLVELRSRASDYVRHDGAAAADAQFFAEQNARVAVNAEQYYRVMYSGGETAWNLRDRHMAETLESLRTFLRARQQDAKVVVWAHNSHLGDARATEMGERGELNVGQLVREAHGNDVLNVGFTTFEGTVTAASDWDRPAERKRVRPALEHSYEELFHQVGYPRFYLDLQRHADVRDMLAAPRLERAIGVIYRPETERMSHYFLANLAAQFDAVLHYDSTRAVEPLERNPRWLMGESTDAPETYPTAL